MPVREVALDRDVRSQRLLPAKVSRFGVHSLRRGLSVVGLLCIDVGALLLALLAESLVTGLTHFAFWPGLTWPGLATSLGAILLCAAFNGLYGRRYTRHSVRKVFSAWVVAFVISSVLMLASNPDGLGARLVAVWLLAFGLSLTGRWVFDALLSLAYGANGDRPRALLLGDLVDCLVALPALAALPPSNAVHVVGLVLTGRQSGPAPDASTGVPPVVATDCAVRQALQASGASQVIIADAVSLNGQLRRVIDECRGSGAALKVVATNLKLGSDAVCYVPGLDCPLFVVQAEPAGRASYLVKQIVDRCSAAALLIVLSPFLLTIAALIKVTSRGPVLFIDERVGIGQRPFRFYKFRTMAADARATQQDLEAHNEADGVLFKIRDDPRINGVGRVLRRFSLDELPQLFNVLKGDMSLVGPRPLPLRDNELMEDWHRRRHVVLPGITGLWQVSGRSDLGFDDMVVLDLRYIETWSLRGDARIILRTAGAVFRSHGAY